MLDTAISFDSAVFAGDTDMAGKPTLRQVRLSKLLSANELWRLSGVAPSTILKIEGGARPHLSTIRKLAKTFDPPFASGYIVVMSWPRWSLEILAGKVGATLVVLGVLLLCHVYVLRRMRHRELLAASLGATPR